MLQVEKIGNSPVSSLCYVLYDFEQSPSCIIIDPGSEESSKIVSFIENNHLTPSYIILTHEHFDHCLSVNELRKKFPDVKLVCSKQSNEAIQNQKKNCSVFWDNTKGFELMPADILVEDIEYKLGWNNQNISFIPTPGHTPGSISIKIGKFLFTGDAYIPGIKTVTKLPGGNKVEAANSENLLKGLSAKFNLVLCAGH